jgi:hypothetical protein
MECYPAHTSLLFELNMLRSRLFAGVLLVCLGVIAPGELGSHVWAQSVEKVQQGRPLEGQITYAGLTYIEVEGKSYHLHPKVSITAEDGRPLELKQLQPGQGIQFWLKEGAMYQVIAIPPR